MVDFRSKYFMDVFSKLVGRRPDFEFNPEIELAEGGETKPVLEHLKEVELSNNDVSRVIPNIIKDLKSKENNFAITTKLTNRHPQRVDEVIEVLETLVGDSGWRSIKVFTGGATLGDIDDEIDFIKFALMPKVRNLAFERMVDGNPMTLLKILEYAKQNQELKKIINFYKEDVPENYNMALQDIELELDSSSVNLLQSLKSDKPIKYKPTPRAENILQGLNEDTFTELYRILETVDGNNPIKRFMKDSIGEPAKIKILKDIVTGDDPARVRGQVAEISAGTKTKGEKSWKRFYGKLTPREYVISLNPSLNEEGILGMIREIKKPDTQISRDYQNARTQNVDITRGELEDDDDLIDFLDSAEEEGLDLFQGEASNSPPKYPFLTILILNDKIEEPNSYKFVDFGFGKIQAGKAIIENMLFIFSKFNMSIKNEFRSKFNEYMVNGDVGAVYGVLKNLNFSEVENEIKSFIDQKAGVIKQVIIRNIMELLGTMNSKLTYYKPSPKAFKDAGRTERRRVKSFVTREDFQQDPKAQVSIDTDTAIEYLYLVGLIEERE
jgi:hypothetical protein|tara:strand:+ start:582 stop:2240 length:1659 start_codon:yes stop_codon:yes gene_type:complete